MSTGIPIIDMLTAQLTAANDHWKKVAFDFDCVSAEANNTSGEDEEKKKFARSQWATFKASRDTAKAEYYRLHKALHEAKLAYKKDVDVCDYNYYDH